MKGPITMDNSRNRWASPLAWIASGAALLAAIAALLAGPGYRLGWWPFGAGIQVIFWSAITAIGALVIGLIATGLAVRAKAPGSIRLALVGVIAALAVALPPLSLYLKAQSLPHIHDITTDTDNPPAFVAVLPLRQGASNSTQYPPETAVAQKDAYPEIAPRLVKKTPDQAFAQAEGAARRMGWQIVALSPADHRIEATDTSLLFGFKDDIVIRVRPHGDGSRIDVRSLSRVGRSDIGVNAKRIRKFMREVDAG